MKIKANGITFNYEISGPESAPWLIFSNSLATNLHMWDPQADALKNEFRMLRYDQRGHGETEATAGRYTFELLCDDVIALMDALGIQRAHWCGVSMGCATGMGLVQKHPGRFDRMVLCDNPGRSSPETHKQWEERIAVRAEGRHGGAAGIDHAALVSAGDAEGQSAAHGHHPPDDPDDAGQRLRRLLGGARRPRLPAADAEGARIRCCGCAARRTATTPPP